MQNSEKRRWLSEPPGVVDVYCRISGTASADAQRLEHDRVVAELIEYYAGRRISSIEHDGVMALVRMAFIHEQPPLTPLQLAVFAGPAMARSDVFAAHDGGEVLAGVDPEAAWVCAYARLGYPDRAARESGFWQLAALSGSDFALALYSSNALLQESMGSGVERHIQAGNYPAEGEIVPTERLISAGSLLTHAMDQSLDAETRIQAARHLSRLGFARLLPALKEVLRQENRANDLEVAASI